MSYRFVAAERASFPAQTSCRVVGVAVGDARARLGLGRGTAP